MRKQEKIRLYMSKGLTEEEVVELRKKYGTNEIISENIEINEHIETTIAGNKMELLNFLLS